MLQARYASDRGGHVAEENSDVEKLSMQRSDTLVTFPGELTQLVGVCYFAPAQPVRSREFLLLWASQIWTMPCVVGSRLLRLELVYYPPEQKKKGSHVWSRLG